MSLLLILQGQCYQWGMWFHVHPVRFSWSHLLSNRGGIEGWKQHMGWLPKLSATDPKNTATHSHLFISSRSIDLLDTCLTKRLLAMSVSLHIWELFTVGSKTPEFDQTRHEQKLYIIILIICIHVLFGQILGFFEPAVKSPFQSLLLPSLTSFPSYWPPVRSSIIGFLWKRRHSYLNRN